MDKALLDASILRAQLMVLRGDIEQIEPEAADRRGRPGSGVSAFIAHFNSLLRRFREVFSANPVMLQCVAHIEPVQEIQERLSASYHQHAKANIIAGAGSMLSALDSYVRNAGGDTIRNELQNFLTQLEEIYERAVPTGQADLGWEALDQWKRRIFQFIDENLSREEAQALQGDSDPFTDLADEIRRCKSALVELLKGLHSHPEKLGKRSANSVSTGVTLKASRQLEAVPAAVPEMPGEVTLSWLWQNVPVRIWGPFVSVVVGAFIAGAYLGSVPVLRPIFELLPGYSRIDTPRLPSEKAEQVVEKVKELIGAHNQRLADLQRQLLYEERLAGDHSLISSYRDTHRAAADKVRELIERENVNFRRELEALRSLYP